MSGIEARFRVQRSGFALDVDLRLPATGVSAVFGPSGCGKTTLLRCMAGLTRAPQGRLHVAGECWQDEHAGVWRPTHRRPIGYVFQEASLFPHLSVQGNLDFAHRRSGSTDRRVVDESIALFEIDHLLPRSPERLSGGERQRVAIARALASSPRILLMDEPLAALDAARKAEILPFLERLHRELSIPVIYVTHSMDEVARLADHLVVLDQGRVDASGAMREVLARLDSTLTASEDAGVALDATVAGHDAKYRLTRLDIGGAELWAARVSREVGSRVRVRIHARDVSLALFRPDGSSITNILASVVEAIAHDGPDQSMVRLRVGDGARLLARITRRSCDHLALDRGMVVYAQVKGVVPII